MQREQSRAELFGLPYMGSKNFIAKEIVAQLPPAECFVDLFAGGCAVTHAAIVSRKYKRFIINDVNRMIPQFFKDAVAGKYRNETRVIDRETFHRLKTSDPYVRLCWSFGNAGDSYLWSEENERVKLLACRLLLAETWQERRLLFRNLVKKLRSFSGNAELLESLERLERVQALARLERVQALAQLERVQALAKIEVHGGDYREVAIPADSCVYCDPPYESSKQVNKGRATRNAPYFNDFDFAAFREWVRTREFPVYVSEYAMPDDFVSVWSKEKRVTMANSENSTTRREHLFLHERFAKPRPVFEQPQLPLAAAAY